MHELHSVDELNPKKGQLLQLSQRIGGTDIFKFKGDRVIRDDMGKDPTKRAKITSMYLNEGETDLIESGGIEIDRIGKNCVEP